MKKNDSVLIVDIGSGLRLLNVGLINGPSIKAVSIVSLPQENKNAAIPSFLHNFIKQNNITGKDAVLCPPLKSLFIKRIQLPSIPHQELPEAVKWHLKDELAYDIASLTIDYYIIKETEKEDGSKILDLVCFVLRTDETKPYIMLLKDAGLYCRAVVPFPLGYSRLIPRYLLKKEQAAAVMHVEEEMGFLSIHKGNRLEFYREIPVSINKLREALKIAIVSEKGKVELSREEIDEVLFKVGLMQEGTVYKDKLNSSQILSMVRPNLERVIADIKRSFAYYESQFKGEKIHSVFLSGVITDIPNIDRFLSMESGLDISNLILFDKMILPAGIDKTILPQIYADFGVALEYEQGIINLLPYQFKTEKRERFQRVSLRWLAIAAFLLLMFSYVFARVAINAYTKRLDTALFNLNVLSEVREVKASLDGFNKFIADTRNAQPRVRNMLKKLSGIAGKGIFIESLSLDAESASGRFIGFIGDTSQNPDAALTNFVRDVEQSVYFSDVSIYSVEKVKAEEGDILKFNITFRAR